LLFHWLIAYDLFLPVTQVVYPPQRKRLVGLLPQSAPEEEDEPELANNEICLLVLLLVQVGQLGDWFNSLKRIIFSNGCPHSLQTYSYNGIHSPQ